MKKLNPELLNEELKKFRLLSEYSFYTGENDLNKKDDNLLLGNVDEDDEKDKDLEPADNTAATDSVANDLGVDTGSTDNTSDDNMSGDLGDTDDTNPTPEQQAEPEVAPEVAPEIAPESGSEDVEVDVTSLVKGSEEAKQAADAASQNTGQLLQKFSELEHRVASMDKLSVKIDTLEKEIVKRNPTPVEKLEMRSLNSFPYSLKLTDYWDEKEGNYNVKDQGDKKEYILTKDDVDNTYSDSQIKQSFAVKPDENSLYEEEEI